MKQLACACMALLFFCSTGSAWAGPANVLTVGKESGKDPRSLYQNELLLKALERTVGAYGYFELNYDAGLDDRGEPLSSARKLDMLEKSRFTVLASATDPDLEKRFLVVREPVFQGLLGWRIFLIKGPRQAEFSAVKSLGDLARFTCGQARGWQDVPILEHAGLPVRLADSYHALFPLLMNGGCDDLGRAAHEAYPEQEAMAGVCPGLAVETSLLLHYPLPTFFFVNKDQPELARRLAQGLASMRRDGSQRELLLKHFGPYLRRAGLAGRKLFELKNPYLSEETRTLVSKPELWFDPRTVGGGAQ